MWCLFLISDTENHLQAGGPRQIHPKGQAAPKQPPGELKHGRHLEMRVVGGTSQSASLGLDGCQGFWAHPQVPESVPQGLAVGWGWQGQGVLLGKEKEQLLLPSFSCSPSLRAERVFESLYTVPVPRP